MFDDYWTRHYIDEPLDYNFLFHVLQGSGDQVSSHSSSIIFLAPSR